MREIILSEAQAAMVIAGVERRDRLLDAARKQEAALAELAKTYARMAGLEGERFQIQQGAEGIKVVELPEDTEEANE